MSGTPMNAEQAGYLDAKERAETGEWRYSHFNQTGADPDTPDPAFESAYASGVGRFQQEQGK